MYGVIMLSRVFDGWYTGVDICDIIGHRGKSGLWVFMLLYIYPGW